MKPGEVAPAFSLPDQDGTLRALDEFLAAGPLVLFFYPAASTTGCTREACHFRDLAAEFAAAGATRAGISMDAVARQKDFASANGFDYPLLSDVDGAVARLYGVKRSLDLLKVRRTTFVISPDRRILEVFSSELNMNAHAERALAALARR
ncbi:MAG: peroxiredoxin [Acidobacteriota bacterium]|nr:peroxiredoxin [Acidobacteriota bacterium]